MDAHMDTIRVDIAYRPLRIGWAIQTGDMEAFRSAVRLSYALWGGRFNPILIADNDGETKRLVDLFLIQYGGYPSVEETWVDYREVLKRAADATEQWLEPGAIISSRLSDHPSIPFLSRLGLQRHHSIYARRDSPGFFVGDVGNLE